MQDTSLADDDAFADGGYPAQPRGALEQLKALSLTAKLTIVYVLVCAHLTLLSRDLVLYLGCMVAHAALIIPLLKWWQKHSHACPLDMVIRSFGMGYCGMALGVVFTLLLGFLVLILAAVALPFMIVLWLGLPIYVVGIEELFRVLIARRLKSGLDISRETITHQIAYTATSVGYAAASAALNFVVLASLEGYLAGEHDIDPDLSPDGAPALDFKVAAAAGLIRMAFSVPVQVLAGYMTGLNTTRRLPFKRVGLEAFALRSALMMLSILWELLLPSWLGLIAVIGTNIGIVWLMVRRIKRVEAQLPQEYLQRVGYLQAFGYGVLPGGDPDEVEIPDNIRQLV
eukprot:TRINITY_DN1577_c0_g1_i2.p1 TRINITY_DN1577_c0_g1~~TRINITY_DN1577_c0_g1_i2.p1  ORF type:complete len:342 (+),score=95.21 TRINITY_DN1577_c0_g1_i2:321-1346(+)